MRTAVKIAYIGEDFSGSQIQPGHRTVEGDVLSDLQKIFGVTAEELDLKLASRTDKGVNALGNVAVFNSKMEDPDIILKALNAISKKIFYRGIAFVDDDFNPRFADVRAYRYIVSSHGMDLNSMRECIRLFIGEHDLKRFCRTEGKSTIVTIDSIDIAAEQDLIIIDFKARYYLWNMIRRIMAAVMAVGRGDSDISDVRDALEGKDITFGLARPDGLTLTDIYYKNIDFMTPSADMFDDKVEEEMFKSRLKTLFYTSL